MKMTIESLKSMHDSIGFLNDIGVKHKIKSNTEGIIVVADSPELTILVSKLSALNYKRDNLIKEIVSKID